jgi:hypothetical protein
MVEDAGTFQDPGKERYRYKKKVNNSDYVLN